jgi:tripartite-type tricarboxylate transporter receptor subunit TctC
MTFFTETCALNRRNFVLTTAVSLGVAEARASSYPNKVVRIVVPYAPGGAADISARRLAQGLSTLWKQSVVVDNKPGAGGVIGTNLVAKAPNDGYTLLFAADASITVIPALTKVPYDPMKDLAPITRVTATPNILAVHTSVTASTLAEFTALLKNQPGRIAYGSSGLGTLGHLAGEIFQKITNTSMIHVPYRGGGPAVIGLAGGEVQASFATTSSIMPFIQSGKVRALATTSKKRLQALPSVPTMEELGLPDLSIDIWAGMLAPRGTDPQIIEKIARDVAFVMALPESQAILAQQGSASITEAPTSFARFIKTDFAKWAALGKARNIKLEQ